MEETDQSKGERQRNPNVEVISSGTPPRAYPKYSPHMQGGRGSNHSKRKAQFHINTHTHTHDSKT